MDIKELNTIIEGIKKTFHLYIYIYEIFNNKKFIRIELKLNNNKE